MDNLTYFDFVSFDLITLIISSFDNDSLSNFLNFYGTTDFNWNYIYFLHFKRFIYLYEYYGLNLSYKEYYDYLSIEKLKSIFNIEGETRADLLRTREISKIKSDTKLTVIPKEIGLLINLSKLIINNAGLENIEELYQLINLEVLNLRHNKIKKISDNIINLKQLRSLLLDFNNVSNISNNLYALSSLVALTFYENNVNYLSDDVLNLLNLKDLVIGKNPIERMPTDLTILNKLKVFNINSIKILKDLALPKITMLYAADSFFRDIPDNIINAKELEFIFMPFNGITRITTEFDNKPNLRILALFNNEITEFHIKSVNDLIRINLRENQLNKFPESVLSLHRLKVLNLSYNKISEIPINISNLQRLDVLILHHNNITSISLNNPNINIKTLIINNNNLNHIDVNPNIRTLSIYRNKINDFSFINRLINLRNLIIDSKQKKIIDEFNLRNVNIYIIDNSNELEKKLPEDLYNLFYE